MSPLTIALTAFLSILSVFLGAIAVALFTPVVLVVDSARAQLRVRWILGLEYQHPLPGAAGTARFALAGKTIRLRSRKPRPKPKRPNPAPQTEHPAPRRSPSATGGRFFYRCLREAGIRRVIFRQGATLAKGIYHTADLTRWRANISLPDPASTGMLAGLTQFGWGRRLGIATNFTGENSLFLEIRFHPWRIVKPVLGFLIGLPYRAIFRLWRASLAEASAP